MEFHHAPQGFWKLKENHKKFFDWLWKEFGYVSFEDWYKITTEDVEMHGGSALVNMYNGSVVNALLSLYPEYDWKIWEFVNVKSPLGFWDRHNQRKYFDWLGHKSMEDWYNISHNQVIQFGGRGLLDIYNRSPMKAIVLLPSIYSFITESFDHVPLGVFEKFQPYGSGYRGSNALNWQ